MVIGTTSDATLQDIDSVTVDQEQLDFINEQKNAGVKGSFPLTFYTQDYDEAAGTGDKVTIMVTLKDEVAEDDDPTSDKNKISGNDFRYEISDGHLSKDDIIDNSEATIKDKDGNELDKSKITIDQSEIDKLNDLIDKGLVGGVVPVIINGENVEPITIYITIVDYRDITWYDTLQDPPIKKVIDVTWLRPGKDATFTFTMTGLDGAPMPEEVSGVTEYDSASNTLTAKVTTKTDTVGIEFGNITYTKDDAGNTYTYVIKEVNDGAANYTYDEVATGNGYIMTVTIEDNGYTLVKTVAYAGGSGASESGINIINTYTKKDSSSGGGGNGGSGGNGNVPTPTPTPDKEGELKPVNPDGSPKSNSSNTLQNALFGFNPDGTLSGTAMLGKFRAMPKTGEAKENLVAILAGMSAMIAAIYLVIARKKKEER